MSLPLVENALEDVTETQEAPAPAARPAWASRLAVAAILFVAIGGLIALAALLANPLKNADVLSAGVTLVVAGAVLRSIATPAET